MHTRSFRVLHVHPAMGNLRPVLIFLSPKSFRTLLCEAEAFLSSRATMAPRYVVTKGDTGASHEQVHVCAQKTNLRTGGVLGRPHTAGASTLLLKHLCPAAHIQLRLGMAPASDRDKSIDGPPMWRTDGSRPPLKLPFLCRRPTAPLSPSRHLPGTGSG